MPSQKPDKPLLNIKLRKAVGNLLAKSPVDLDPPKEKSLKEILAKYSSKK